MSTLLRTHWLQENEQVAAGRYAAPSIILRCSMFSARPAQGKSGRIVYTMPTVLTSQGKVRVKQVRGTQLVQADGNVYFELLRRALEQPGAASENSAAVTVRFVANEFLKSLNRSTGKSDFEWLRRTVDYLHDAEYEVRLRNGSALLTIRLLRSGLNAPSRDDNLFSVSVSTDVGRLFREGWTAFEPPVRAALSENPLAQWLHYFYSTHREPEPIDIDEIKILSGMDHITRPLEWRRKLDAAIDALATATNWKAKVKDGQLYIDRCLGKKVEASAQVPKQLPACPPSEAKDDLTAITCDQLRDLTLSDLLDLMPTKTRRGFEADFPATVPEADRRFYAFLACREIKVLNKYVVVIDDEV